TRYPNTLYPNTSYLSPLYPNTLYLSPLYPNTRHLSPLYPTQHLAPQYPQLQASNPVPGLSSAGSQAMAGSPHTPFSHLQAPPLLPNPLPPQDTFSPSPWPEPSQGAVPLQQMSQLFQDLLYPGFPVGPTGNALPTPPYSSNKTGGVLPHDPNVLRWFFNLGVKAFSNPIIPPYMYLWPLRQSYAMHHPPPSPGPHPDPAPLQQGVHPSPPLPWQQTPPPGYPSSSPGLPEAHYPGPLSPGLQLRVSTPGGLEGYGANGANGANVASDSLLGTPAEGVLADQGHQSLTRPVLLVDPPLNNMPIWVSEPQPQDSMVAMTTAAAAPHGSSPALYTPDKGHQRQPYHSHRTFHKQAEYAPVGGPGPSVVMEQWISPESGPFTPRARRYPHRGGGGGAQQWRGGRGSRRHYGARGAGPNFGHFVSGHRTTDQGEPLELSSRQILHVAIQ
ncbi:hypothetical protein CRUP_017775, partial [Coryphaenoides rupestris]